MKQGQDEFFAVVGEGAALLKNLDEKSSGFFDDLNRLREILAILGYESAVKPLQFSLADKEASAKALWSYLGNGLGLLPDALAVFEAETVADLASLAGDKSLNHAAQEWAIDNGRKPQAHLATTKLAAFENLAARGVDHGVEQSALEGAMRDADTLLAQSLEDNPAYSAARAHYDKVGRDRTEQLAEISEKIKAARVARDSQYGKERAEAEQILEDLLNERAALAAPLDEAQIAAWDAVKATHAKFNEDRVAGHRALFEENGQKIIAKVAEASPITPEQAQAWASEQIIDDNAKAKLKRLGYKPDDVVRDMAEFYRLTGGKASAIRIGLDGGRRANAVGITERLGEKVINLGGHFNKTVLFHELAHHLENDPIAKAASNGFLIKRRESEQPHRLRDLTGNKGYDAREVAYKDGFTDPYVGKIYRDGVTEVWSMGVQYLANPKDAAIFAAKDPEMFKLITGYLTMPTTPAMSAKLNMHKGAIGDAIEKKQNKEAQYEQAVKYLAAQAVIAKDDWFDTLDREGTVYDLLSSYVLYKAKKDPAQYVGSNGDYRVFSGVFRNPATKRNAKGYMIVDTSTGGDASSYRRSIPDHEIINGDLEQVQAVIAVAKTNGTGLFSAAWNYFRNGSYSDQKQNLVDFVGAEKLK
jgi:hypothetical protein